MKYRIVKKFQRNEDKADISHEFWIEEFQGRRFGKDRWEPITKMVYYYPHRFAFVRSFKTQKEARKYVRFLEAETPKDEVVWP